MKTATREGYGIRILRQDPWETLISFIISQNIERPLDVIVAGREIGREPCCGEPPLGPSACLSGLALLDNAFDGSVLPPAHVSSLYRHKFRPGDLNQRSS